MTIWRPVTDLSVIQDGVLVTSKGPATAMPFALKLVELLAGHEAADEVANQLLYITVK